MTKSPFIDNPMNMLDATGQPQNGIMSDGTCGIVTIRQ